MEPKKSCKCVFLLFVAPTQARSQKNRTSACFQRFQTLSTKNMKNRKKKQIYKKLTRFQKTTNLAKQAKKAAASGGQRRSAEVQRRFSGGQRRSAEVQRRFGGSKLHQITKSMKIIDLRVFFAKFLIFFKFCVIERFLRFARTNKKIAPMLCFFPPVSQTLKVVRVDKPSQAFRGQRRSAEAADRRRRQQAAGSSTLGG